MRRASAALPALGLFGYGVAGAGAVLHTTRPDRIDRRVIVAGAIATVLALLVTRFVLPRGWRAVTRAPRLLVPFGVLSGFLALRDLGFEWLGTNAVVAQEWAVFGLQVSAAAACEVLASWIVVSWAATAVWDHATGRAPRGDSLRGLGPRPLIGALVAGGLGWAPTLAVLLPSVVTLFGARGAAGGSIAAGLVALAIVSFVWNLLTAPLLLLLVRPDVGLGRSLRDAARLGITGLLRWGPQVVVHLMLLGLVTVLRVSVAVAGHESRSTAVRVNGAWHGAFPDTCHWFVDYAGALSRTPPPLTALCVSVAMTIVAVALQATIAARIVARERPSPDISTDDDVQSPE